MSPDPADLTLKPHPFEVRAIVETTMAEFAGSAGPLDLISYLSPDCPAMVIGDGARLRQVLGTLVGNAVRFTEHGDVLLRVEPDAGRPPAGQVRLRFTVADTGIGISPARLERLFTSPGAGGLPLSWAIVEAMGGALQVTSVPADGTEFTFTATFGRCDDPVTIPQPRRGGAERIQLGDRSALLVADDDTLRGLRRRLEGFGMVCSASPSALDALALVRAGRSFDIALLDAHLPMMDAVQLASALRHLPAGHRFPLVLLSDRPDQSDPAPDRFAAVLARRPHSRDLFTTISQLLAQQPTVAVAGHPEAVTGVR